MPGYDVNTDIVFVLVMFGFGLILSFNRSYWGFGGILLVLLLLIGTEVSHIAYFGAPLSATDVSKLFSESSDIWTSSTSNVARLWFAPLAILAPFVLIITSYLKWNKRMTKFPFAIVLVLCFFFPKIHRATQKEIKHFLPSPVRYVMHNSINTFSFYVGNEAWSDNQIHVPNSFYEDYQVSKGEPLADNVYVLMGESVGSSRMSLYGAPRQTSPFADSLKGNTHFYAAPAIASGVSTHTSLNFFLNMIREPGNQKTRRLKTSNLFRLAKEQGYRTYFISSQDAKSAYDIGAQYIDEVITKESMRIDYASKGDAVLVDAVKNLPRDEKKFVFIFTRTAHDPYDSNYEQGGPYDVFKGEDELRDSYDNSLLAFDGLAKSIFEYFLDENKEESSYFIVSSDHGQLLGENGLWGHNRLDVAVAEVPFWFYSTKQDAQYRYSSPTSHYEIGHWIASLFGYDIKNANMGADESQFIHGNNFLSNYEFIEYDRAQGKARPLKRLFLLDYIKQASPKPDAQGKTGTTK